MRQQTAAVVWEHVSGLWSTHFQELSTNYNGTAKKPSLCILSFSKIHAHIRDQITLGLLKKKKKIRDLTIPNYNFFDLQDLDCEFCSQSFGQ